MAESRQDAPAPAIRSAQRPCRPAKPGEHILIEPALDSQISGQGSILAHIGPDAVDPGHDGRQGGRGRVAPGDLDRGIRIRLAHEIGAAFRETHIARNPATRRGTGEEQSSRCLSDRSHAADTARWRPGFQTGRGRVAVEGGELEDVRRVKKLRRKIHRELPVASASRIADLDHRMSYRDIARKVQQGQLGVDPAGAALALCRACTDRGLTSWCYEFGFPQILTHAVTIVEIDGVLRVHDPYFNLGYRTGFLDMLQSLRNGNPVTAKRPARDKKIYILDPAREPEETVRWLEANADREFEPANGVRRFELAWTPEAFSSISPAVAAASRALADRGYPGDLKFLMLHPLAVFDGHQHHRDPRTMPLVGGLDLEPPAAALRVMARQLEAERACGAERAAAVEQLRAQLAGANSQIAQLTKEREEPARAFAAERETWLQQKVALQADNKALEAELAKTRSQLSVATNLRAQRDSQIAQLRAEIEDSSQQFELHKAKMAELEAQGQEWETARLRLEIENRDLQLRLEAGSRQYQSVREKAALLEARMAAAEQQIIEMTHYLGSLPEAMHQPGRELRTTAPGSRLRALWQGLAGKCVPIFRRCHLRR